MYFRHGGFFLRNSAVRRCLLCHMLDSPLEWVIFFAGVAGRARRATFINEQAIKTEADLGSQAGRTLFLLHTKYLGWDKGFPDGAIAGTKAHDPSRLLHGALCHAINL